MLYVEILHSIQNDSKKLKDNEYSVKRVIKELSNL